MLSRLFCVFYAAEAVPDSEETKVQAEKISGKLEAGEKITDAAAGQLVELINKDNPEFMKNTWPTLADEIDRRAESVEKEKAVSEDTDSTAVNDNPAEHTAEQQRIIEEYKNAVDEGIVKFYEQAKTEQDGKPYEMKPVSDRAAEEIYNISGKDVHGFRTLFDARQAWHINNDHGPNGRADHSMSDSNDVGRIQYVIDNYDSITDGGTTDAYWEPKHDGKRQRRARTVVFSKKVNGTYYVVEAAPVTAKKAVQIVSAYMLEQGKTPPGTGTKITADKNASQLPDATAPWFTSENDSGSKLSATTTVTQETEESNSGKKKSLRELYKDGKELTRAKKRNEVNENVRENIQDSERSSERSRENEEKRRADAGDAEGVQTHDGEGVRGDTVSGRVYTAGDGQRDAGGLRQQDTAVNRQNSVNAYGVEAISSREAGLKKGSVSETVFEIPEELYDEELKIIAADAEENGLEIHMYTGLMALKNGKTVDGYHKDGVVWIKADSHRRTATEAYDHEKFHMAVGRNKQAFAAVAKWLKSIGGEKLGKIIARYTERYGNSYDLDSMSDEEAAYTIIEEIMADAYAGADVFKEGVTEYTEAARAVTDELGATKNSEYNRNQGRAPPQGMTYEDVKNAVREVIGELTGNRNEAQTQESVEKYAQTDEEEDYDAPITEKDIDTIRSIGRKSINDFTSEDIKKAEKWAYKFYQELGTKSPLFRAWFGDWRANDTGKVEYVQVNSDFISNRNEIPRGTFTNRDTEWQIKSTADGIDETTAKRTKHSDEYRALRDIDSMISNAVLLDTIVASEPSKRMGKNAVFVHHLYCPILIDGKQAVAKMYVTEDISDTKRFYLTKIEKVSAAVGLNSEETVPGARSTTADTEVSVSDIFNFVKENDVNYEADSKRPVYFNPKSVNPVLLNENGTPRVFYHGTDSKFTEFKASEFGLREGSYFFAQNYEDAAAYTASGNVMEVYVSLKNPIDYNDMPHEIYKLRDKRAQVEALKELGYDGWYADMDTGWGEISAFYPEQIKSATDNIGTFNSGDADIRYAIAGERSRTVNLQSLREAKQRASEGEDANSIYEETGWYQGADGKWRYEIDDSDMEYRTDGDAYLDDIIKHDKLFDAYPELRMVRVEFGDTAGTRGEYHRSRNTIIINNELRNAPESTLLHEIQHAIQNIEEFEKGANPEYWENVLKRGEQIYSKGMNETLNALIKFEANPENAPIIEAYKDLNRAELEGDSEDRYDRMYQWVQDMGYEDRLTEYEDLLFDFAMEKERQKSKTPKELYYNTAGEEEARDVSARRKMSAGERRKSMPKTGNRDTVFAKSSETDVSYSLNPDFASELDKWDGKGRKSFFVGNTSEALKSIGIKERKIIWHSSKISAILNKHEGMTLDIIKQVPNILEKPIIVLKSQSSDSRISVFGEVYDANGVPVTAILELQPTAKDGRLLNLNIIASAYGKDTSLTRFVENSELLYLETDKKRTKNWLQSVGLQLPSDTTDFGSIGTVTYQNGKVKIEGVPYRQYMNQNIDYSDPAKYNSNEKYALSEEEREEMENTPPEQRLWEDTANRSIHTYGYTHPELRPYYESAARLMYLDATGSLKGMRWGIKDSEGYYVGSTGQKRSTTDSIANLLDNGGMTYERIATAAQVIANGKWIEEQHKRADVKKVEY